MSLDKRITPARSDLAASFLKGKVTAERFADGTLCTVSRGRASLRAGPEHDAAQETELLFGEGFTVYEEKNGWSWGQSALDGYVGYVHTIALGKGAPAPDHRIAALMTPLLPAPDVKRAVLDVLPMNAKVKLLGQERNFAQVAPGAYVCAQHVVALDARAPDWVAVAERFVGTPYVWGGKTHAGLDCSGLIQTALEAGGIAAPRDTDMQEQRLGHAVAPAEGLQRGDLVFWKGHAGIMLDAARLVHANAFHMEVRIEKLADAIARIETVAGAVTSIKHL